MTVVAFSAISFRVSSETISSSVSVAALGVHTDKFPVGVATNKLRVVVNLRLMTAPDYHSAIWVPVKKA